MRTHRVINPADFSRAMAVWMQSKKYRVGVQPQDINLRRDAALAKQVINITEQVLVSLLGGDDPFTHISGGAKSEKVVQALAPFVPLSDLIGLRFGLMTGNDLMVVIFADNLSTQEIVNRLKQFMELADAVADLGLHVNFRRQPFFVFPLVVCFNNETFHKHSSTILSHGFVIDHWADIGLRPGMVNVLQQTVNWAEFRGVAKLLRQSLPFLPEHKAFVLKDLHTVLHLAQQQVTPGHTPVNSNSPVVSQATWQPGEPHRDYPNVIAGEQEGKWYPAPGHKWVDVKKDLRVVWQPGQIHRDYLNVIAGEQEGVWHPAAGYVWANPNKEGDWQVVWYPGYPHQNYPNVIAGEDGKWYPAPGYKWIDVKKNLQVVWQPEQIHRDSSNVIAGKTEGAWSPTAGYRWVNPDASDDFRVVWCPGRPHEDCPNVVAGEDGKWYPAPGYRWVDVKKDLRVVWQPGQIHRDYPNVIADEQEERWYPVSGYQWIDVKKDLRVVWMPGLSHRDKPNLVAGQREGEWKSTVEHSPNASSTQVEQIVTSCPTCSQKLRAPGNRGTLKLSCPKCKHSWRWSPTKEHL